MGTLFEQPVRTLRYVETSDVENYLSEMVKISKKMKIPLNEVLYSSRTLELQRQNNLYVSNGDISDEKAAGFGKLFQELNDRIEMISTNSVLAIQNEE